MALRDVRLAGGVVLLLGALFLPMRAGGAENAQPTPTDPQQAIAQHLERGRALLAEGEYVAAQAEFAAVLQLDTTHPDALRLMTKAQRQLEAQQAKAAREQERLRQRALDLAVKFAQEKAKERARQEAEGKSQVALAREQQLKYLYTRGLSLYRQGDYQSAIEILQQMALLDPSHPLVHTAQRLIAQAETKLAEARARAYAKRSSQGGTLLSELEQQLAAKRIEFETVLKYAKIAMKERNYDVALQLAQRVLVEDPRHRQAQQLLEQAQEAKLKEQSDRLKRQVVLEERTMDNQVLKAQILPDSKPVQLVSPPVSRGVPATMAAKLQQPISLEFEDVALPDVLQFIADAATISIIPSPQLDLKNRRVSLKITELPLETAIKYLAKSQALAYRIEEDVILIASAEEFKSQPFETRIFFLHSGLGPFALEAAALQPPTVPAMDSLKQLITQSVPQPPGSKLVIDERSGALVVTNTTESLTLTERLLSQLDTTPLQVLIEARFVELTMTELEQLGFEAVLTGDADLTKKGGASDTRGPAHQLASGGGIKFPALARESEGANITLQGVLTGTQFESVLHLLEETQKSKTLSAPRVTTLNNQPALIRVVDEFRYPTRYEVSLIQFDINGDGDFDDAGETEFANVPQDFQKRDIGILLHVTPSVGHDLKTVTLLLAPEVSSFSQFRDLGGGVTVPEFTSSQLTTSVVIEDGQTVVLGGLMKDTTSSTATKVPVLGDLPLVGNLFRQTKETSTRKNLLIFITARVLGPRGVTT